MNTQSNYRFAITRTPPISMANGITTQNAKVNIQLARCQHETYVETLRSLGIKVTVLDPDEKFPDSHFVEDTAIIHKETAILTRPGAQARQGEPASIKPALECVLKVHELGGNNETLVDGGDVLFMGKHHVLIGIGERTNLLGAECLRARLIEVDPQLEIHFVPFTGVLHLKSGLTAIGPDLLLGNPEMKLIAPLSFANILWLPPGEGYAANTLSVNGATLYFAEAKIAGALIQKTGLKPIGLNLSEFRKMDGSFTCLSLLW